MNTIILEGVLTATSNKQSADLKVENPRKTLYVTLEGEERQKALDFGLVEYGKEEKFFMIKPSEVITVNDKYKLNCSVIPLVDGNGKQVYDKDKNPMYTSKTKNFSSDEEKVAFALMEGENMGQRFVRCYAIQGTIKPNENTDAFADHKTDIEKVEIDLGEFSTETVDNSDDLPF